MEEPGGLQSTGSLRVRHNSETSLSLSTFTHWRRKWQPTPVFLPGESRDGGAWWAAIYGVAQSQTRLKRLSSSSGSRGYILVGGTSNDVGKLSIMEEVRFRKVWDSRGCWETRLCACQALVVLHFILGATGIHQRALESDPAFI